ncbi:hypothetical protein LPJ64_004125 [Coemansia asiatica]|uniref:Periplasmic binding protein n=1 Tax=Coemansia asiatica TaxID=1052880 RepID=A0A9W7XIW9_9FUNG|nr:hypothetical protein LPJ64_004125 [Coemansia asiatica]
MRASLFIIVAGALFATWEPVLAKCSFDQISVDTNPGFQITVNNDYKLLEDSKANVKYGLYCDSQPSGVDGVDKWFKVPVESVGIRIPIASGFLEALGLRTKITAAESPGNLTNICLDTSKISTLNEASGSDESSSIDVIFSADAKGDAEKSVRLPSDDSLSPLQKAEWIKFVGSFFNQEKAAESLFTSISDSYSCHSKNMQKLKTPPHAYWVEYTDDGNDKKVYSIITSAYQKELLANAGATNDTKEALSDSSDQTKFQDAVKDADYVFDQTKLTKYGQRATEWYNDFGYTDPQNSGANFLLQRQLWRTDGYAGKSGISSFAEFGYVRPDLVLQDIINVVVPVYNQDYSRRWIWWLGGTNEDTEIISEDNYSCESGWMSVVEKCVALPDFDGTVSPSTDEDGKEDDSKESKDSSKNDDKDDSSSSSHGRAGKIAGGVVAGVAFIGLVVVAMHYYNRRRRIARRRALSEEGYGHENIGLHARYSG